MVNSFFSNEGDVDFNYEALSDIDVDSIDSSFHSQLALYLSLIYGYSFHSGILRYPVEMTGIFEENSNQNSNSNSNANKNTKSNLRKVDIMKSPVVMNYENEDSQLQYSVILNPLHIDFQQIGPIVKYLRDSKAFSVRIYINFDKDSERKEFPTNLRGFHRFLLKDNNENGNGMNVNDDPKIIFDRFDSNIIYSVIPHVPENWMIVPTQANFDLDNFKVTDYEAGTTIDAKYRLSSILVEGSALDEQYIPVHGLRIVLDMNSNSTDANSNQFDLHRKRGRFESLSIKTMGYFQLQSQPGIWRLTLGEGPSRIVYNISSSNKIIVSSFVPLWVTMLVHHNEGMTRYNV